MPIPDRSRAVPPRGRSRAVAWGLAAVLSLVAVPLLGTGPTPVAEVQAAGSCPGATYTVVSGDSWWRIAVRSGVTMTALLQANGATSARVLHPGDVLCLPAGATTSTTVPGGSTAPSGAVSIKQFPVQGLCWFSDSYGAPRSGGRSHEGVDILAAQGNKVYAVDDGVLTKQYIDAPGSLSGNGWRLTRSDGTYFFYAHFSAFAPGLTVNSEVKAGQILGLIGMTGNAGSPHLHFEIHPGGGPAVNPTPIVSAVNGCKTTKVPPQPTDPPTTVSPTTTTAPASAPTTAAPVATAPVAPSSGNCPGAVYTVRAGDSWSRIAARSGVTLAALLAANNAVKTKVIHPGNVLCLPTGAPAPTTPTTPATTTAPTTTAPPLEVSAGLWQFIAPAVAHDGALAAGAETVVDVGGLRGVAPGAPGVMVRLVLRDVAIGGHLTVYPCAAGLTPTSTLNYSPGRANAVMTLVGVSEGKICVLATSTADMRLEVVGFVGTVGIGVLPTNAWRALDTRPTGVPLGPDRPIALPPAVLGAPRGTKAVTVTLTLLSPVAAGELSLGPCGGTPWRLEYTAAAAQTLSAIVRINDAGLCLSSTSDLHVVVDITGVWSGNRPLGIVTPTRLYDSRFTAPIDASTRQIAVALPPGAARAQFTIALIGWPGGTLFAWNCRQPRPDGSVSYTNGTTVAVTVTVNITGGSLCLAALGTVHAVVDLTALG